MPLWTTPDKPVVIKWACRSFVIPYHILDKVNGAINALLDENNWEVRGTETIEDTVEYLDIMVLNMRRCFVIGQVISGAWEVEPSGTIPCDGAIYLRVDYPALYATIDNNLKIDADTFTTPLMQGSFPKSPRGAQSVGDTGGVQNVTLTLQQIPSHAHRTNAYSTNIDLEGAGIPDPLSVGLPTIPSQTGQSGGDRPHTNIPPYTVLKFAMVAE